MHTMEAYTTLYEATHKEVHKRALQEIIDIVLKHMVDYDFWCGRNQFSIDFTPKPAISIRRTWNYDRDPESANKNPLDTTSYGHNIELIWLLNRAYEVLGLPPAREFTRKICRLHTGKWLGQYPRRYLQRWNARWPYCCNR